MLTDVSETLKLITSNYTAKYRNRYKFIIWRHRKLTNLIRNQRKCSDIIKRIKLKLKWVTHITSRQEITWMHTIYRCITLVSQNCKTTLKTTAGEMKWTNEKSGLSYLGKKSIRQKTRDNSGRDLQPAVDCKRMIIHMRTWV